MLDECINMMAFVSKSKWKYKSVFLATKAIPLNLNSIGFPLVLFFHTKWIIIQLDEIMKNSNGTEHNQSVPPANRMNDQNQRMGQRNKKKKNL